MRAILAVMTMVMAGVTSGAADPVPAPVPVPDKVNIESTSGVYQEEDGDYGVIVVITYEAAGPRDVSVCVFDENTASWQFMLPATAPNLTVVVQAGKGRLTFWYEDIPSQSDWGDYMSRNSIDLAFVQATSMAGVTPAASDSRFLGKR